MTTRRRRPCKEHVGEEDNSGGGSNERLPERLFATDRYPSRRLNVYLSLDFLVAMEDVLHDMKPKYKEKDYAYWDKLYDGRRDITIPDVVKMVTEDLTISRSRRLKLCLIIIVDGVLITSTQPARPTLKHVKRVESLKNFLAFQWGRESFYWTVSGMIQPKRIMGVCNDPTGEFFTKLRQKTKKMTGLPLALQLVAYECIPQLLARLGGNDDQKIIDCESLPQHTGLNLVDILDAEHHHEVTFCNCSYPMMEIEPDKLDGWGEWDDVIDDRRVKYMVRLIEDGHKFKKSMWRGGDAAEDLYDHEKRKAANKRKRQGGSSRTNVLGACVEAKTVEHLHQEADFGR
ncbi:unnamed protein product [Brassica napus]|uniref:(rape) hypothetical protein n=1 Tax=Brassica napus TaxID=3708 RepID=A0A816KGY4_BRANA|nr:unnamed protein product [Brassica napus]